MKKFLAILLVINNIAFANAASPVVVYLPKTTPAPFDGYLFTPEKEKDLRLINDTNNYLKQINSIQVDINKAQTDEIDVLNKRIEIADKKIASDHSWILDAAYFVGGALVTGLIAQGLYRSK